MRERSCFRKPRAGKGPDRERSGQPRREDPQFYEIWLDDFAAPSFCSFSKTYVGTREEILALLKSGGETSGEYLEAAEGYFAGTGDGEAVLCYNRQKILSPAELIRRKRIVRRSPKIVHRNVWDCPYQIRAKKATVELLYTRSRDGAYRRCVKAAFERPEYAGSLDRGWSSMLDGPPWGFPGMLRSDTRTGTLRGSLAYAEKRFKTKGRMLFDMLRPGKVEFKGFFDDFFGDG